MLLANQKKKTVLLWRKTKNRYRVVRWQRFKNLFLIFFLLEFGFEKKKMQPYRKMEIVRKNRMFFACQCEYIINIIGQIKIPSLTMNTRALKSILSRSYLLTPRQKKKIWNLAIIMSIARAVNIRRNFDTRLENIGPAKQEDIQG